MDCCNTQNQKHYNHKDHSHGHPHNHSMSHGHGMGHGSAQSFLKRFWIVTALLIPLALVHPKVSEFFGISFGLNKWIQFGIATVIFGFALIFFQHAWHEIKAKQYGMMTLVSIAVSAGYLFSVASTFIASINVEFYLEISTLIWVLLFGHYLEAKSGSAAGNALQEVAKLLPKKVHILMHGEEREVDISELVEGSVVVVKPGEKIPADGSVKEGSSYVNEAHISGESKPVQKKMGDEVVAGSIALDGSLTIVLSRVGEHSTIGQIQKLISDAQATKPKSQKIADKAAALLTLVAGITAILTLLIWMFVIGKPFVFAMTLAITVLVIACPHALGLAIPTVTTITTSLAVKNGVFIKNLEKIEVVKKADYIVFDKTGTLTEGSFGITDVVSFTDLNDREFMKIAGSLDQHSSHVIGKTIVEHAKKIGISFDKITDFKNIAGRGSRARIGGSDYAVGNSEFMKELGVHDDKASEVFRKMQKEGKTVVFVTDTKSILGVIALADEIKKEASEAIKRLHSLSVKVAMITGDNEGVAKKVAENLGIDTYFADVLPKDKYVYVKKLQDKGNVVVMVGDGVNDAPALTQANVGVAIGAGTDVAVEAGDVVLTRNSIKDVVRMIVLARKVYSKMIQNLLWALGYNVIAIPAAAGVFAVWGFFLRPEIGALVMSLSTAIVVANALTLKKVKL